MTAKGELARRKIIKIATAIVNRKGFGATTIQEIISATGMQKGGIYFHFPDKDALGLAILEKARADFLLFLDSALSGDSPGACLENFFRLAVEKHLAAGFIGGCIFGNTAIEFSDTDSRFAAIIERVFDEWIELIRRTVSAAQDAGQVRTDIPATELALHIVATIEGGIMLSRLKKNEESMKKCLDTVRTFLHMKTV
ncbi:MAG: TetR/AcrR family transcriptional regulator [Geobacter sp.]|nr:TetR/AcrR family transcriptional regulator [Geobacter sp.]